MAALDPARDDPFFAELRRKHPDVDIVLLPPVDTLPPDRPPATIGRANATQRHTSAVLAPLWNRVGRAPTASVGFWWQQANPHLHRYVSNGAVSGFRRPRSTHSSTRSAEPSSTWGGNPSHRPPTDPP